MSQSSSRSRGASGAHPRWTIADQVIRTWPPSFCPMCSRAGSSSSSTISRPICAVARRVSRSPFAIVTSRRQDNWLSRHASTGLPAYVAAATTSGARTQPSSESHGPSPRNFAEQRLQRLPIDVSPSVSASHGVASGLMLAPQTAGEPGLPTCAFPPGCNQTPIRKLLTSRPAESERANDDEPSSAGVVSTSSMSMVPPAGGIQPRWSRSMDRRRARASSSLGPHVWRLRSCQRGFGSGSATARSRKA